MALTAQHQRWLAVKQGVLPALLNVALNAAIAWWLFRGHARLTLWGEAGVGSDLLLTGFILAFAIGLANSIVVPRQVAAGKLPALPCPPPDPGALGRAPKVVRAAVLGALGVIVGAGPLLWWIGRLEPLSVPSFVGIKGLWAGGLAVAVSMIAAWWALVGASRSPRSGPSNGGVTP